MKLYSFFRSGTSHRLRIALNLKGVATDYVAVDLRVDEQQGEAFKAVNPALDFRLVVNPFYIADRYSFTGKALNSNIRTPLNVDGIYWTR